MDEKLTQKVDLILLQEPQLPDDLLLIENIAAETGCTVNDVIQKVKESASFEDVPGKSSGKASSSKPELVLQYSPDLFLDKALQYMEQKPKKDLVQASEKIWVGLGMMIKLKMLELNIFPVSHKSLAIANDFFVCYCTRGGIAKNIKDAFHKAEKLHKGHYGSYMTYTFVLDTYNEVQNAILRIKEMKIEKKDLDMFLNDFKDNLRPGFDDKGNELDEVEISYFGESYKVKLFLR